MKQNVIGTVVSVKKQWWLKINTKPVRLHTLDGATFPHIITVKYAVGGNEFYKRKWIRASEQPPAVGAEVTVFYDENNPGKSSVNCPETETALIQNTKWKDVSLMHKIVTVFSIIVALSVVLLAILQIFDIWRLAINFCVPLMGINLLCLTYTQWNTNRKTAYFNLGCAVFILMCAIAVFCLK